MAAAVIVLGFSSQGSADTVNFDRLSLQQGLSQSNIFALTQDSQGYIWMGTESAADRFDGHQIDAFRHDPANANTITSGAVVDFHSDQAGNLWILTEQGMSYLDLDSLTVARVLEIEADDPVFGAIGGLSAFCDHQVIGIFGDQVWQADPVTSSHRRLRFVGHQPQARLTQPVVDPLGHLWLSDGHDLWRSDCQSPSFKHVLSWPTSSGAPQFGVSLLTLTGRGDLAWAGPDGIGIVDPATGQWRNIIRTEQNVLAISTDELGGLWAFTETALMHGQLNDTGDAIRSWAQLIEHQLPVENFPNKPLIQTARSGDGVIWVSVGNLFGAYTPNEGTFERFSHSPTNPQSLPPTAGWGGYELFADRFGVLWVGAKLGGVARYVPERHRFEHIRDITQSSYVVRGVAEQRVNNQRFVWVGLDNGGLQLFERQPQGFERVDPQRINTSDALDLSTLQIRSFAVHPRTDRVWFNGVRWLGQLDAKDRSISFESRHDAAFDRSRPLAFSPNGRYLYQALGPRLIRHQFNADGEKMDTETLNWAPGRINPWRIRSLSVLSSGTVLIATENQLFAMQPWDQTAIKVTFSNESISNDQIISMLDLGDGRLLLGTASMGLIETRWSESQGMFQLDVQRRWSQDAGLPDVTIYALARDPLGRLWLSTNRGLSRLDINTNQVLNFTLDDGLQAYEFNSRVVHQTRYGHLYFGGINGVNAFDPAAITPHPEPPIVRLKQAQINEAPIFTTGPTTLKHQQNNWVFEFVGLHTTSPTQNRYAYRLEGLDNNWVQSGTERVARYTALDPGNYRFWVRSANSDGVWSEPKLVFQAQILPPPWLSPVAYVAYGLLTVLLIGGIVARTRARRVELQRLVDQKTEELRQKNKLVTEQSSALQEALNARTLFFANISHELRTPLTLIEANLSKIEDTLPDPASVSTARRYLNRMVQMVDQLLDLSQIRAHGAQTESTPWSLTELLETTHRAYQGVAEAKHVKLTIQSDMNWVTRIDSTSAEKILLNLLTNAIKFTPAGGKVQLELAGDEQSGVWLRVCDTGPGIPESEQALIFDRFHRVPIKEAQRTSGAGIGLALVSEAVAAVGGRIELTSQVGQGSVFAVWLPAEHRDADSKALPALAPAEPSPAPANAIQPSPPEHPPSPPDGSRLLGRLLVVEDNPDLLAYLVEQLSSQWSVIKAENGLEAIECLRDRDVDIILSDIMMPHLDGLSLLKHIRDDFRTSHIPFLFLTARGDNETELQGLMLAADDFVRKPFDARILQLKLKNLIDNRRSLQQHLGDKKKQPLTIEHTQSLSPRDHRFVEKLNAYLDTHYGDETLSVASLAAALAVDERTLQRKTNALFGQPPARFINAYRIKQACQLLLDPGISIQEVAYACGYTNPRYFSRVFTEHKGETPSQWRKQH